MKGEDVIKGNLETNEEKKLSKTIAERGQMMCFFP